MLTDGYNGLTQLQTAYAAPYAGAYAAPATTPVAVLPVQRGRNDVTAGIIWVTLAMALLAGLAAFARASISAGVPPLEVVFFRNLFATLALAPLLAVRGLDLIRTQHLRLYGLRCGLSALTMSAWFYALALMPIGELTAFSFLAPLFGTLAAVLILGEVVRARRWTALLVGFAGAMIILRPGLNPIGIAHVCAIGSALIGGVLAILVKQLTDRDDPSRIVFLTNLILTPLSLVLALFVWVWPPLDAYPLLLGMGVCAVLGHLTLTRAFAAMDASLVLTFEFSKLPFAVAVAYFAFGETIDAWTWVGAAVIFGSAIYVSRREAQLRRERMAGK
jgi:drug/metabolite transporter (DMT)-like permease